MKKVAHNANWFQTNESDFALFEKIKILNAILFIFLYYSIFYFKDKKFVCAKFVFKKMLNISLHSVKIEKLK